METTTAPTAAAPAALRTLSLPSGVRVWSGRVLTALAALFLAVDAAMKIARHPMVLETSEKIGIPGALALPIGLLLAACLALYLVPRTAPLGAVLLTGYLGGAVLTHLRIGDPPATHTLFPVYVGALLWAGLSLRDARVRALLLPVAPRASG